MSDRIESDRTIEVLPGQLGGTPIPTHADPMPGRSTSRLVRVPSAGGGETGKPLEALHHPPACFAWSFAPALPEDDFTGCAAG